MIIIVPQMITFLILKLQSKAGLRLSLSLYCTNFNVFMSHLCMTIHYYFKFNERF